MKKGTVFYHPIDGLAALTISWSAMPKGDAVEAKKGEGVGFFSEHGTLLSVIFDEVSADEDHQVLEFSCYRVEVFVKKGRIKHSVIKKEARPKRTRRKKRRKKEG